MATTWVRFDDTTPENAKIANLGDAAFRLWFNTICVSGRNQTDGFVPSAVARRYGGPRQIAELVNAGCWHPEDGGYQIHDYLEHQRSRAQIARLSAAGAKAGKTSALQRSANEPLNESFEKRSTARQRNVLSVSASAAPDLHRPPNGSVLVAAEADKNESFNESLPPERAVLDAWTAETGFTVAPAQAERMLAAVEAHGLELVLKAIAETGSANVRNWNYTASILERYQREGTRKTSRKERMRYG